MIINDTYDDLIRAAASRFIPDVDWRLLKAQYWQESRLIPDAVSPAGAVGIAQFMPATWKEQAPRAGYPHATRTDPEASIFAGAHYMRWLRGQWSWPRPEIDRHCLALASYNSGLGDILKAQRRMGGPSLYWEIIRGLPLVEPEHAEEPIEYVKRILRTYVRLVTEG